METGEMGAVRAELAALREMVSQLLTRSTERPRLYEFAAAARLMGVAPKTVSRMVASGELLPVMLRGKRLIPVEEIDRVCAPPVMASSGAAEKRVRFDAAAFRAATKKARGT